MKQVCSVSALLVVTAVISAPQIIEQGQVHRRDFYVESDPGIRLFVREVTAGVGAGAPLLLVHGARVAGIGSFDLPAEGGSLAAELARRGWAVYVMDVRGYARSTRPPEMSERPEDNPPLVRSPEAVRDIGAVVDWIRKHTTRKPVLLGWATGGNWAGYYAALHSDRLSGLVIYNALYGGSTQHSAIGHGSDLEDGERPGYITPKLGAYRLSTAESLLGAWDRNIPAEDKSTWRSPAVAEAYVREALDSDPTSRTRNPASMRSPSGALEDSFYQAVGRQLWDASFIRVPTLVIASELDFWSRSEDRQLLQQHLVHAPKVRVVVIPGATHFVHLDRMERGRERFLQEITAFLTDSLPSACKI